MNRHTDPLSRVKVATPCPADWESMAGNDRRRFCGQCQLNVYNLSGMTKREAEELLNQTEGRLCVRFYRRADGTILTQDCPVGLRAMKRRLSRIATAMLSTVLGFFSGLGLNLAMRETDQPDIMGVMTTQESSIKGNGLPIPEEKFVVTGELAIEETGLPVVGNYQVRPIKNLTSKRPRRANK